MALHLNKFELPLAKNTLCLVEIGGVVLEKKLVQKLSIYFHCVAIISL